MICKNPYVAPGGNAYGCGQCMPCRVNKRRQWVHRIMLEAAQHGDNSFVTLTYNDEHLPHGNALYPQDLSRFLKRLRRSIYPQKIRYFGVGEYGDTTQRPHYHIALFGYPHCRQASTDLRDNRYCCPVCERVQRDWGLGKIHIGTLENNSAAYLAGYVTKKLTKKDDPRLEGRHPEFARMSNRPGIGGGVCDDLASIALQYGRDDPHSLPSSLKHGSRGQPLDRYLRSRLRHRVGISDDEWAQYVKELTDEKMQDVRAIADLAPPGSKMFALKNALIDAAQGRIVQIESKSRTFKKRTI